LRRRTHQRQPQDRVGFWPTSSAACRPLTLIPRCQNPEWVRWDAMPKRHAAAAVPTWIKDATRRLQAKLVGCDLPPVLGHADWEAQNLRWRHGDPHVVHDWDSLAWLPEAAIAGSAAGIFASHGKTTLAPLESSEAFLHATKANAAPASRPTRRRSPGRRASGKLSTTPATN
jgi:hypothetical protein